MLFMISYLLVVLLLFCMLLYFFSSIISSVTPMTHLSTPHSESNLNLPSTNLTW